MGVNPVYTNYSTTPLIIHHKIPVLNITEIGFNPSSPNDGEAFEIRTTILNSGDVLARNIIVRILIDDMEIDETIVEKILPNNNTFEVIFDPIVLEQDSYTITVKVIYDDNQTTKEEILKVKEKPADIFDIFLIIFIVLIIIIIIILFIMLKHKNRKEPSHIGKEPISSSMEQISCPQCNNIFYIPLEPGPLQVQCPSCGAKGITK